MDQQELRDRFCQRILSSKDQIIEIGSGISGGWSERRRNFIDEALNLDLSDFLRWYEVSGKMTYQPNEKALVFLRALPDWQEWDKALIKSDVGNPYTYELYPRSCGNMVNQAHHLANFMVKTKSRIQDFDTIFEFGGGFGCMCRFIHLLGFTGQYIIADLPEFGALQEYYLSSNFPEKDISYGEYSEKADIIILSDVTKFDNLVCEKNKKAMFIALWSLSECPMSLRDSVLRNVFEYINYVLISFQIEWYGYNNQKYFTELGENNKNFDCDIFQVSYLNHEHWYMCGKRKDI